MTTTTGSNIVGPSTAIGGTTSNAPNSSLGQQQSANPGLNISSVVHLPPLQNANHTRFPERVKRTQFLQKQRLKREFFY